ncbi:MAG: DUF933 domain-containing protein, partial [Minisyncoccales bacterium]
IEPNIALLEIPDERLEKISRAGGIKKIVPGFIEFVDIAGLVQKAHLGEGMGNQFLSQIRHCQAILILARAFENEKAKNYLGRIDPQNEFSLIETELIMKDLETVEKILKRTKDEKEKNFFLFLKEKLTKGQKISSLNLSAQKKEMIRDAQFLTEKPVLYVVNSDFKQKFKKEKDFFELNVKEEFEMIQFSEKEKKELDFHSRLDELVKKSYEVLNLITFFTIAKEKEVKAWMIKKGSNILEGARKIHSDFKEKFIKAQIGDFKDLLKLGSWKNLLKNGKIKIVGRDYIIQDGDIIEIKI